MPMGISWYCRVSVALSRCLSVCACVALLTVTAPAADLTWDPGGAGGGTGGPGAWNTTDPFWDDAGTYRAWSNLLFDSAIFGGTAGTVTLGTPITASALRFDTTGYTVTGNTLTLSGGTPSITTSAGVTATISSRIVGSEGLLVAGTGTVRFQNSGNSPTTANTYTGGTIVSSGTLELSGGNNGYSVVGGGSLTIRAGATVRALTHNSLGQGTQTNLTPLVIDGGTFEAAEYNHVNSITMTGGTLAARSGITQVDGMDMKVRNSVNPTITTNASASTATISSRILNSGGPLTITVADGGATTDLTMSGIIAGTQAVTKAGFGTMSWTAANTLSGSVAVTGGTLVVSNSLRNTAAMTVSNGATLELGSVNMFVDGHGTALAASRVLTASAGTLLMNGNMDSRIGNVTLNDGSIWTSNRSLAGWDVLLANVSTGAATVAVTGNGPSVMNGTGGIHLQGVQNFDVANTTGNLGPDLTVRMTLAAQGNAGGSAGGVNKLGAGTMLMLVPATYTGATTVSAGTLQLGDLSAAGVATGTTTTSFLGGANAGTVTVDAGGTLAASNVIGTSTTYLANTLAGAGTLRIAGAGLFGLSGNTNTFSGTAAMQSSGQLFGGLTLDYTAQNNAKLGSTATLDLNGGNLRVIGNASAASAQTVGTVNVLGGNVVTINPGTGQTATLTATTLTQSAGGMLTVRTSGTLGTDANFNVGGATLGRWATVQSNTETDTQFATTDGSGNVVGLAWTSSAGGGTALSAAGTTDVYLADSAQTITTSQTIDSLGLSANVNLDSSATLTLGGGGIVFRNAAATLGQSSGRGSVTSGLGSGDLLVTSGLAESADFQLSANIVDNGGVPTRLIKGGTGQLIVGNGGTNAYTGGTIVSSGRLRVNNAGALGAGPVEVRPGGQVWAVVGSNTIANDFVLAGLGSADGSANNYGALRVESSPTFSGGISVPQAARINIASGGATAGFTGVVSGAGDLEIRSLAGSLAYATFTNSGNTFTGRWIVRDSSAVLRMASDAAFGPAPATLVKDAVVLDGGRLQFGSTGAGASFTLNANRGVYLPTPGVTSRLQVWGGQTMTIAGPIAGFGNLSKSDGGTAVLQGVNPVSGIVRVEAGTLTLSGGGSFPRASQLQLAGGFNIAAGSRVVVDRIVTSDASGGVTTFTQTGGDIMVLGSTNNTSTGDSLILGHWPAATTYTMSGGSLGAPSANLLFGWDGQVTFNQSAGTVSIAGLNLGSRNAVAQFNLTGGRLNIGANGIFSPQTNKSVNLGAGTLGATANWSSAVALNVTDAATGVTVDPSNFTITLTGALAGSGKLAVDGLGTLSLGGANTFSGGTDVRLGRLLLTAANALRSDGAVTVSGGTLDIAAVNADLGGTVTLSGGTITGTTGAIAGTALDLQSGTLDALVAATSSIVKTTAGTATLAKVVSAPIDVQDGTLVVAADPSAAVTLTGGLLDVRTSLAAAPTFAGGSVVFRGGGSLAAGQSLAVSQGTATVAGGGSLGLANEVSVTGSGTLAVSGTGSLASALVSVTGGGSLDLTAATGFTWGTGQTLTVGRTGTPGTDIRGGFTLSGGSLTVTGTGSTATFADSLVLSGGTVNLDLSNDPSTGANDFIDVVGALTMPGSTSLQITKTAGSLGSGTYNLFGYGTGSSINTANLVLAGASGGNTRQTFTLGDDTVNSLVTLTVAGTAGNLVWMGDGSNAWNFTATDWDNGGTADRFYDLDNVVFDDIATGSTTVDVTAAVAPNSILVNNSTLAYSIGGAAKITGTTGLVKNGSGTLTLANTGNDFTGPTAVNAGTLALGAANALSPASVLTVAAGATLDLAGNSAAALRLTGGGDVTSATAATLAFGDALSTTFSGGLGGAASLVKNGVGSLTFTGTSSSTGSITVAAGSLLVGNGGFSGSLGPTAVALADGTSLVFDRADAAFASGIISRSGAGTATLRQAGSGSLELSGSVSDVALSLTSTGSLTLAGAVTASPLTVTGDGDATLFGGFSGAVAIAKAGSGTLTIASAATHTGGTTVSAGTLRIGAGGTAGSLAGNIANSGTVTFDRSDASEFAGVISGTGAVRQTGLGTTTLSATNTYTGGTTVSAGTLAVAAAANLGGGSTALALETGGTLATTASFSTGRGIAVSDGTLDVATGTTLTVNSGGLSGSGTLTKAGLGQLDLTSASGMTGSIVVAGGTLRSASQAHSLAAITVNSGATLHVAATNTFTAGHGAAENMLVTIDGGSWTNTGGTVNRIGDVTLSNGALWTLTGLSNDWGTYFLGPVVGGNQARVTVTGSSASTIDGDGNFKLGSRVVFDVADVTGSDATDLSIAPALQNGVNPDFAAGGIEKTGPGTLVLSGNNVYTNGTVVAGGVLSVASVADAGGLGSIGAVGSSTGFLSLTGGGTLRYTGTGAESTSRNLFNDQGNGGIEVTEAAGSITFTGGTSGGATANALSFTKSGPGAVVLAGTNTFSNAITLEAGTLRVGAGGTAGAISGNVANSGTLVFDRSDALTYGGLISGAGDVVKESAGTLTLSNTGNSFTGNVTIAGGTISAVNSVTSASASSVLGAKTSARSITVANGGRLAIGVNDLFGGNGMTAANIPTFVIEAGGEVASTRYVPIGDVTLAGGTLTQSSTDAGSYEGLQFIGTVTVSGSSPSTISTGNGKANHLLGGGTTVFDVADVTGDDLADLVVSAPLRNGSGNYSGNGSLRKTGLGTMTLSAASSYSGGTTVAGGTLRATNADALGTGNVTVDAGATLFVDAVLNLQGSNAVSIAQGGFLDLASGASVPFGPGGSIRGLVVAPGLNGNRAGILAGTSRGGRASAVWMGRPGGSEFVSDVLDLSTGNGAGPIEPFVLSVTYDSLISPADEASTFLFWNSTPGGTATWVNAVVGNVANNASLDQQAYLGSFSQFQTIYGSTLTDYMGAYGRDETTNSVWAVMNHNSEFVVTAVPEPGTLALVAAACAAGLTLRKRRPSATL